RGIASWEIECGRGAGFDEIEHRAGGIEWSVHCPPRAFPPGTYTWRYRGVDGRGAKTEWSRPRTFTVPAGAAAMPMPERAHLLARIPRTHPRLFLRPENLAHLRELAGGALAGRFRDLEKECERILAAPPPTEEPRKYPPDMARGSEEWRSLWWGNRVYTIRALDSAAKLGFTRLLGGKEEYGQLARRILLECARWDPKGATGYRYNDEAGMPYAYYFSRTYSFIHDLLSEGERSACCAVMKIRGDELYRHLCPAHLWRPYGSHSNRAWHFLGEVGIAFLGEVEGAEDWIWFAMNVFFNVYPVWSDAEGGWHEGVSYWSSYIGRFTWWADVMRAAMGIDAYDKPYFSKAGYYAMYLMPPGKTGGGFGDGASRRRAQNLVPLMSQLAAQAGNPHWRWYVEQMGGPSEEGGYIGFIRGALPEVSPSPPGDLATSRLFRGTGQAYLNTTLMSAAEDVQVVFKSSPRGTWSHGSDANNAFLLFAYGERLLIRSGHYYNYGGPHHAGWVWSTRSVNSITVNGRDQLKRSPAAKGEIVAFRTSPSIDIAVGEAGGAYGVRSPGEDRPLLERFTRAILFVKPDLVVVYDRLAAPEASSFEYWLHAIHRFEMDGQRRIGVRSGGVLCDIDFLAPDGLILAQTDQYDPNPVERIREREWHLTASTPSKARSVEFVALYRPHRATEVVPSAASLQPLDGGYLLEAQIQGGTITALLPSRDDAELEARGLRARGRIAIERRGASGEVVERVEMGE
ncbi:MAG: DUF4962 domain-containing protein, partial [Planctomycetes bacterium]|nr:DUF4962 domain-containing protein [Planctomycetota bacterium]